MTISIFDGPSNYFDDNSIFQGSSNVELLVDVKCNIDDAIECRIHVIIPTPDIENETETTTVIWIGTVYQGTFIRYLIQTTDLPVVGIYKLYSYVKWANNVEIPGETAMLNVRAVGE